MPPLLIPFGQFNDVPSSSLRMKAAPSKRNRFDLTASGFNFYYCGVSVTFPQSKADGSIAIVSDEQSWIYLEPKDGVNFTETRQRSGAHNRNSNNGIIQDELKSLF